MILVIAWVALAALFLLWFSAFAGHRKKASKSVEEDVARLRNNDEKY